MPGTGHSARYKGSISNRVRISPFQRLAEWNAQLLGADGAVPTITGGGGSLAFKKLDASDIDGVMTNPASTAGGGNLNMASFGISNIGTLGGVSTISNGGAMTISTSNGRLHLSAGLAGILLQPVLAGPINLECSSTGGVGPINISWPDTVDTANYIITLGGNRTHGSSQLNIMSNIFTNSTSFLTMGSGSLQSATLNSQQTLIDGALLKLGSNAVSTRIGFLGAQPSLRQQYGMISPDLPAGATLSNVIVKVNLIINALVTVGLCE